MKQYFIDRVRGLLSRVTLSCLEKDFEITVNYDIPQMKVFMDYNVSEEIEPRVYMQIQYISSCNKTGKEDQEWKGYKWYLSEHMTDSEIIFRAFAAWKACIEHEVLEGFKVDGTILVNPHVNYEELLKISDKEVKRKENVTNNNY